MTGVLLQFPTPACAFPEPPTRPATNPVRRTGAVEAYWRVADVLVALEGDWLGQPVFRVHTVVDGAPGVWISVGGCRFTRSPEEARAIASALIADQAFAGASGVAARLLEVAAEAETMRPVAAPPPPPADLHVTGRAVTLTFALFGLVVLILKLAERL